MARPVLSSGKLKRRRRNRRLLIAGGIVLCLAAVLGGCAWLSHAAFLRVESVEVTGSETVATDTLVAYAEQAMQGSYLGLFARDNIFLYPRAAIAEGIAAQYPTFRSVDVHAKDFHTVEVAVAEREPVALWCPSGGSGQAAGCSYMDEQGLIYAPAPNFSTDPYISYSGQATSTAEPGLRQYLTEDQFQSLSALVAALATKEPDDPIGQVAVDQNLDVRVYFHDNFMLIFSLKDDGGDIFERFNLALTSTDFAGHTLGDFDYLDLRFGDKLYYKLKTN